MHLHTPNCFCLAAPATAEQGELPDGAQVFGIYVDPCDGVKYQWGACTDGYFAIDMFGWASWPTLVEVVRAIRCRAGCAQSACAPIES